MSVSAAVLPSALPRPAPSTQGAVGRLGRLLPGLGLCLGVTGAAMGLERAEAALFSATWLEALVLAILVGTAVRTAWTPGQRWLAGIDFGAKTLLEVAVLLLGASISAGMTAAAGPLLTAGIAAVVALAIAGSYGIGRLLGLPHRMAMLVACGNFVCGNSAIAAVAPVIGADGEGVAASIAFTAVLGVLVALGLPLLPALLHLSGLGDAKPGLPRRQRLWPDQAARDRLMRRAGIPPQGRGWMHARWTVRWPLAAFVVATPPSQELKPPANPARLMPVSIRTARSRSPGWI